MERDYVKQHETVNPVESLRLVSSEIYGKMTCQDGWHWDQEIPFIDYDIFYVVSGKGKMRFGDEEFNLEKNSCIIMRPGDQFQAEQDPHHRLTVMYVHFNLADSSTDMERSSPPFLPPRFTKLEDYFHAESLLHRIMELLDFPERWQSYEIDGLLKQFLLILYRIHSNHIENSKLSALQIQKIRQVMTYIRGKQGRDIDFAEAAGLVHMSPQYLGRLFKWYTGKSLKEFITRTKLRRSLDLLAQTRMKVSEVAEALDYADVYTFSKQFKKYHGFSPSEYIYKVRPPYTPLKNN